MRHLSADYIFTVSGEPLKNGIVSVDDEGHILEIIHAEGRSMISEPVEEYEGIIVPGFINCHCHLELSHLHGRIPAKQGLIPFIRSVMSERSGDEETIIALMEKADQAMYENGIIAVGDISNNSLSKPIKQNSLLYYHTFVELLGFDPEKAGTIFNRALKLKEEFDPLPVSLAPHAPYSVSRDLFQLLKEHGAQNSDISSMHNQESNEENELFINKTGEFIAFYEGLNIDIDYFKPAGRNSLQTLLPLFSEHKKMLMVHNTYTSIKDMDHASLENRGIYWCFCPKANLYIEGRLPAIDRFLTQDSHITLGTDSLASNDSLCILSELKTIHEHFSSLSLSRTLRWATLNGAQFLGMEKHFGTIEKGKTPGLNLITSVKGQELTAASRLKKLL